MQHSTQERFNFFIPGPIQVLRDYYSGNPLHILRLDKLQSWASGNKYYKLKHPMWLALENGITTLVSKGGMFSNHLEALANACHAFDLQCIAGIRSHGPDERNPSIQRLRALNCRIEYLSPDEYAGFDQMTANQKFPGAMFIDEGGLSAAGIRGAAEIISEISNGDVRHVVISGGSMCTATGLLSSLSGDVFLHIVPAWKGCTGDYVKTILDQYNIHPTCQWEVWPDYHFGGFGKFNRELIDVMTDFTMRYHVELDPVYTGKMIYAITDKFRSGYFKNQEKVLAVHTGGLQGLAGYAYRFPDEWGAYVSLAALINTRRADG